MKLLPIFLAPSWLSLTNIWASYGRSVLLMTPLPITLCGPIPHTLMQGLFREPPALQETERKILLPLPNGIKPTRQHLSVLAHDPSSVTWRQTLQSLQFWFQNTDSNEMSGCRTVPHIKYCVKLVGCPVWNKFGVFGVFFSVNSVYHVRCSDEHWTVPFISDLNNPSSRPEMVHPNINCHTKCKLGTH